MVPNETAIFCEVVELRRKLHSKSVCFFHWESTHSRIILIPLVSGLDETALLRITDYLKSLKNQQLITALKHHMITKIFNGKTITPIQNIC